MARARFVRADADTRRQDLIDAATACLAEEGPRGLSVRTICRRAGVSAGLLTHYFDGIDDLVAATYRHVGARVHAAVEEAVATAGPDPRARLEAYLTASLRPPVLDGDLLATWLSFWSLTKTEPMIASIHGEIYADFRGGIEALLRECWADTDARGGEPDGESVRHAAIALSALVDGLWLELCLDERGPFSAAEARTMALRVLDAILARGPDSAEVSDA